MMGSHQVSAIAASVLTLALTLSSATALQAQTIKVKDGDMVSMTDIAGRHAEGVVRGVSPSVLTVAVNGREEHWKLAETREIWRQGDSLLNGVRYGMLIGAGAGMFGGYGLTASTQNEDEWKMFLGMTLLGVGGGAAIGAAVDAMQKGRTLIHRGPGAATVLVMPAVSPKVRGLQVVVRF
jgi:hypothetical protein